MNGSRLKLLILCTVSAGIDAVRLLELGNDIEGTIVGLAPEKADPTAVSGYVDVKPHARGLGMKSAYVKSYNLQASEDRQLLAGIEPDVVWVAGWQRLVPEWLIDMPRLGVIGSHGSCDGITYGRGRSPQNWALLLGARSFDLSIFRIRPGVDDGPVLASKRFVYDPQDDIAVSYYRAALATAEMVGNLLLTPDCFAEARDQTGEARYMPQRLPDDGGIDWRQSVVEVQRLVRALSQPYPGATTKLNVEGAHAPGKSPQNQVQIWRAQYFDDDVSEPPGKIAAVFTSGDFLVACGDGRLLIRDWSSTQASWHPQRGQCFTSQDWDKTMRAIVERHQNRYPKYPLSHRLRPWINS